MLTILSKRKYIWKTFQIRKHKNIQKKNSGEKWKSCGGSIPTKQTLIWKWRINRNRNFQGNSHIFWYIMFRCQNALLIPSSNSHRFNEIFLRKENFLIVKKIVKVTIKLDGFYYNLTDSETNFKLSWNWVEMMRCFGFILVVIIVLILHSFLDDESSLW